VRKSAYILCGILLLATAVFAITACGGSDNSGGGTVTPAGESGAVKMKGTKFDPAELTVVKGTTVNWSNEDAVEHTVTAANGAFKSGNMKSGVSFGYTFNEVGTFDYACSIHPSMKGKVTVTEK
jgi:plastocyanin